jgi:hypothetical protein
MTADPFPPNSRLVAYLRDSGGVDQDQSIPQQETELRAWCEARGHTLAHVFKDEAISGASAVGREQFQALITHLRSEDRQEHGLLLWRHSRFARDINDAQFYKADLRRRGIVIHSLKDPIPADDFGRVLEAAIDWHNQRFLEDLSEDVKRGLHYIVRNYGAFPAHHVPRGFRRVPVSAGRRRDGTERILHRIEPDLSDPDLLRRIRLAFQLKASGLSIRHIHLQTNLYPRYISYRKLLKNPIYIGRLEYGRPPHQTIIEDYCEPIADLTDFARVQAGYAAASRQYHARSGRDNPAHPRRLSSSFLFSGLLRCAGCGSLMNGHTVVQRRGHGYRHHYYSCWKSKRRIYDGTACTGGSIPKAVVEQAVMQELARYLAQPALAEDIHQRMVAAAQQAKPPDHSLERRLKETEHRLQNLTLAIAEFGHSESLLAELRNLETIKQELEARLEASPNLTPPLLPDPAQIQGQLAALASLLDTTSPVALRNALAPFIHSLTAFRPSGTREVQISLALFPLPGVYALGPHAPAL